MKYQELARAYQELESTTKKLEKTNTLAHLFKKTSAQDLPHVVMLCLGRIFPLWDEREVGIASNLMKKSISQVTGEPENMINEKLVETGDLGIVAEEFLKKRKQKTLTTQELSVKKVVDNLQKTSRVEGEGSVDRKLSLVSQLLSSAKPLEAKYLVRTTLGELRMGVGEAQVRDAIIQAFLPTIIGYQKTCPKCERIVTQQKKKCPHCGQALDSKNMREEIKTLLSHVKGKKIIIHPEWSELKKEKNNYETVQDITIKDADYIIPKNVEEAKKLHKKISGKVQRAYDKTVDFGEVAKTIKKKGWNALDEVEITLGRPIKVMLAEKAENVTKAFKKIGRPAAFETKYDGFRTQIHKKGNEVKVFTRRMEDVTKQFPEIVSAVKKSVKADEVILDAEVVGYNPKTNYPLPFQKVSRRIKRKYDIREMTEKIPVRTYVFDILYLKESLLNKPLSERRKTLEKTVKEQKGVLELAEQKKLSEDEQVKEFMKQKISEGHEGLIGKSLQKPYQPGKRVGHMVKLKEEGETLDLVVVGAQWGEGKRSNWLSSFELACIRGDEKLGVGRMGTGLTDEQFKQMTEKLRPLITGSEGKEVTIKPRVVVEVAYQEIQESPTYESGYALRFPRMVRFRPTKRVSDADTLERVKKLYEQQKKGSKPL